MAVVGHMWVRQREQRRREREPARKLGEVGEVPGEEELLVERLEVVRVVEVLERRRNGRVGRR